MYDILPELYQKVLTEILDSVGDREYYSGHLEFDYEETACVMSLSAVVHQCDVRYPEGLFSCVTDMVPVWWEFHTYINGEEVLNNFSFNELREYLHSMN